MPITRRKLLTSTAGGLVTASAAPYGFARQKRRLRVLGTHVTLQDAIRDQAQKDLGIEIEFQPGGSAAVLHQASTRPDSFDLYEQWSNSMRVLWQAGAIQSIDSQRLDHWGEINDLTKTGPSHAQRPSGCRRPPQRVAVRAAR